MTSPNANKAGHNCTPRIGADDAGPSPVAGRSQRATVGQCRSVRVCARQGRLGFIVCGLALSTAWLSVGGISQALAADVDNWRPLPTQAELDALTAHPINDPLFPYTDYRPAAPGANLDLPGLEILAAMRRSADKFGSWMTGHPGHTKIGAQLMTDCLTTGMRPTHWSDLTLHYYCQLGEPRKCYTFALAPTPKPPASPQKPGLSRIKAYQGCESGKLPNAAAFSWVAYDQPLVFQYVMFSQTTAFKPEQEQAIINAFYGVGNPSDASECTAKRPRRTEDPTDGTHCLVNKVMSTVLKGIGR